MATNPITATGVSVAPPSLPAKAPKQAAAAESTQSHKQSAGKAQSSVKISAAALAASKEASETPAQTAKEAQGGDPAAQKLVARSAANAAQYKA
jgi:hypothetical protein